MSQKNENEIGTDPKISNMITNLKNRIDQLGIIFSTIKEQLLQLATCLDEEKKCERHQICTLIKKLLSDKVKEGKVTARWIEDCLPNEYKRKYTKSEESSLLMIENNSEPQSSIVVQDLKDSNDTITSRDHEIEPSSDFNEFNSNEGPSKSFSNDEQTKKISELEQALLESSKFRRAHELEQEFEIPKIKQAELNGALEDCRKVVFVKFDADNKLKSLQSDCFRIDDGHVFDDNNSDPNIIEKLTTESELSGLLNLALNGPRKLIEDGRFVNAGDVYEVEKDYVSATNSVKDFVETNCIVEGASATSIVCKELYNAYENYCKIRKMTPLRDNSFGVHLSLMDKAI